MKKICIVSYYGLRESLECAAEALRKYYTVYDFPMYKYARDANDKVDNYDELFIKYLLDNEINTVLWWYVNIDTAKFKKIKDVTGVKYAFFNWDEPFNWNLCDLENKSSYFDDVFVTCKESLVKYINNDTKRAYFLYPSFSKYIHKPITDPEIGNEYICDISFCCTNLYIGSEYPDQYINRKKLVDDIYQHQEIYGYKFNIYGPDFLKDLYPKSYRGYISYENSRQVYFHSKINLCTHVLCNMDGYINERTVLVGACRGLLLVDFIKGIDKIFEPGKEIIILDKEKYIQQIVGILLNYQTYLPYREKLYQKCINNMEYEHWAKFIHDKLELD